MEAQRLADERAFEEHLGNGKHFTNGHGDGSGVNGAGIKVEDFGEECYGVLGRDGGDVGDVLME